MPVVVRDAGSGNAMFLVPADAAQKLIPGDAFRVLEAAPGKTQCLLGMIDYRDNDLGDYDEVAIIFFVYPAGGTPEHGVSGHVVERSLETQRRRGGRKIVLRNDDGRYNDLAYGDYSVIRHGAQFKLELGFITSQGEEVCVPGLKYWLDGWEHTSAGGEATLRRRAANGSIEVR